MAWCITSNRAISSEHPLYTPVRESIFESLKARDILLCWMRSQLGPMNGASPLCGEHAVLIRAKLWDDKTTADGQWE